MHISYYALLLTIPFSTSCVNITIVGSLNSQIILQKSTAVCGNGPKVRKYTIIINKMKLN